MNQLNSILLEGTVRAIDYVVGMDKVIMILDSLPRCEGIEVFVHGKLGETVVECLTKGRLVRVIGRLVHTETTFAIEAEHVQFTPVTAKK